MNHLNVGNCWSCGKSLGTLDFGRQDSCSGCHRDTHVCLNCFFHDRSFNNECKESQAERVVDKEKSNFCDYFRPKSGSASGKNTVDDLKSAAEALFKKS